MSATIRRVHRWLSVAFTVAVIPLLLTGVYLLLLPYVSKSAKTAARVSA